MLKRTIIVLTAVFALAACDRGTEAPAPEPEQAPDRDEAPAAPETETMDTAALVDRALAGTHRVTAHRARDVYRNPKETLEFFGLEADMTVIEVYPGGGWYSEVLAPVLREHGQLVAAHFEAGDSEYRQRTIRNYTDKLATDPQVYDRVRMHTIGMGEDMSLGEPGSADMVLTFRNMHSFNNAGELEHFFAAAHEVLTPGGVLGVVAHRAAEGTDPAESSETGYLPEAYIIGLAEGAGFRLDARSEINANPDDTRDHPEGVWTLPPSLRLGDEDRERYMAIGESDRMTLRFVK